MPVPDGFDSQAILFAMRDLVDTDLPGVQSVVIGPPEALTHQVTAYITLAGQSVVFHTVDRLKRSVRVLVTLAYEVEGEENTAELALAALADALLTALTTVMFDSNHRLYACTVDFALSEDARYEPYAAAEVRRYPMVVTAYQYKNVIRP